MTFSNTINAAFIAFIIGTLSIDSMVDHYTWEGNQQQMLNTVIPYYKTMQGQPAPYSYILGIIILVFFVYLIYTVIKQKTILNVLTLVSSGVVFYAFTKVGAAREEILKDAPSPAVFPLLQEVAQWHLVAIVALFLGLALQLISAVKAPKSTASGKKTN